MSTSSGDSRSAIRSFLPQGRLFWVGIGLAVVFLFLGAVVVTGPVAAMMAVWGTTALLASVVGYVVYRVWYRFGV